MGLHPKALNAVMALVLDLLWRGYKVVLSTHSPFVLDVVFALRALRGSRRGARLLSQAFGLPHNLQAREIFGAALAKSSRTFFLGFQQGRVFSRDISSLDPGSDEPDIAGWGGLTAFSGRFGEAIAEAANEGAA